MKNVIQRQRTGFLVFAILMVFATGLVTIAQTPTPAGAGQVPTAQTPAQGGAAQTPPDAAQGRGGRGRGGPEYLAGGPQLDDPAYANVDFSKKTPVTALTPEQELTKFILQPGYRL